ncbi:DUF3307 domain-containing protein [Halosegnis longus]|uniref:DUF3307 domain-containing protein n=1 Tax=Halosegnis longus TaxID=2216012 RepID=UPI00129D7AB1|nr:DUF3307 domain-containing protein [Halosegnis longus]
MTHDLSILAGHAAGDFLLQTDRMANEKIDDSVVRAEHVSWYTAAIAVATSDAPWSLRQRVGFLVYVWLTHYIIDSRRWNDAVPIWYDQAFHVIALSVGLTLVGGTDDE